LRWSIRAPRSHRIGADRTRFARSITIAIAQAALAIVDREAIAAVARPARAITQDLACRVTDEAE
jgi:hypothetical protein